MNQNKTELIKRVKTLEKRLANFDGWENFYTGLGMENKDKRTGTSFARSNLLQREELLNLYRSDGIGRKLITIIAHDMLREKFKIINDEDDNIKKSLQKVKLNKNLKEALIWQDLFGGSIIFMGINDDLLPDQPLNENNIQSINFLKVYDRHQINISASDLYSDPGKDKYGEPEFYNISPTLQINTNSNFVIHESRILRFDGELLPDQEFISNQYWHDSVFQSIYERVRGIGETYANIETIISEFIIGIMKIQNLDNHLQMDNGSTMMKRLHYVDMSKSMINSILMDSEEDFSRITSTVTGLEQLINKLERAVASSRNIPVSILFGDSIGGLNASGVESVMLRRYYDHIASLQEEKLKDNIERFLYLQMLAKKGPTKGIINPEIEIQFNPLWQPTEKEIVETKKVQAEVDQIEIQNNIVTSGEVAMGRHGNMEYSIETELSDAHLKIIEAEEKELLKAAKNGVFELNQKPEEKEEKENNDI